MPSGVPNTRESILSRRVEVDQGYVSPCLVWQGAKSHGYGCVRWERRTQQVHLLVWQWLVGPLPEGLEPDHLCHTADESCPGGDSCPHRACSNEEHLEWVTPLVNSLRGRSPNARNARKTHCAKEGHPLSGDNLIVETRSNGRVVRRCRACSNFSHSPGQRALRAAVRSVAG